MPPNLYHQLRCPRSVTAVLPWADVGGRPLIRQPPTVNYLTLTGLTGEEDGTSCFYHGTCLRPPATQQASGWIQTDAGT